VQALHANAATISSMRLSAQMGRMCGSGRAVDGSTRSRLGGGRELPADD